MKVIKVNCYDGVVRRFSNREPFVRDQHDRNRLRCIRRHKGGPCRRCGKWIRIYKQLHWDGFCSARCEGAYRAIAGASDDPELERRRRQTARPISEILRDLPPPP